MNQINSTRIHVPRRRTQFPGAAELERLLIMDLAVIAALLLVLLACRS